MNIRSEERTQENLQVLKTILETAREFSLITICWALEHEHFSLAMSHEYSSWTSKKTVILNLKVNDMLEHILWSRALAIIEDWRCSDFRHIREN